MTPGTAAFPVGKVNFAIAPAGTYKSKYSSNPPAICTKLPVPACTLPKILPEPYTVLMRIWKLSV